MERLAVDSNFPEKNNSQIFIYQTEGGKTKIEVRLENETVWLTQKLMAELFQTTKQNISFHIQNIYNERELSPEATVKEYLTVQKEGNRQVSRIVDFYNLDMIISVGYRIKSHVATRFRQWATQRWLINLQFGKAGEGWGCLSFGRNKQTAGQGSRLADEKGSDACLRAGRNLSKSDKAHVATGFKQFN
jgi:hypothetical protein